MLGALFGALLALLILFEEWGWEPLQAGLARIGRLPPLRGLEPRIRALPPYAALALLAVPALALLPLKLAALWLLSRGHGLAGLLLIIGAKLGGTAVLARLFALTQPALLRMPWFARWYARWLAWKTHLLRNVRATWAWRRGSQARRWLAERWRGVSGGG